MPSLYAEGLAMARAVLANLFVACATLGAGLPLARYLPDSFPRAERLIYSWLGGFGLLSCVLFLVGQYSFGRLPIFVILFGGLALLGYHSIRNRALFPWESLRVPKGATVPVLVIVVVLAITLAAGFAAPTGDWSNDAIAYHLLGPKVWVRDAVIHPVLDNCHTAFPATVELIFAALLAAGGALAPGLSAVWTFALFLTLAYFLARRCGLSERNALWAVALIAAMPAIYSGAHTAFVDVIYAAFVLVGLQVMLNAESNANFAYAGAFCGFAVATKYTGLLAVPIILLCGLLYFVGSSSAVGWRWSAARLGITLGVACAFGAPFYIRNWIWLGSPIYPPPPVLANFVTVRYLSSDAIAAFHAYIRERGKGLGHGVGAFLLLPYNLTFHTSNFHGAGGIGLVPLAFAPFGLWMLRMDRYVRALALFVVLTTIAWFVTQQESRFLIAVYVILAIVGVAGWQCLRELPSRVTHMLCCAVVGLSLGYGLFMIGSGRLSDIHAAFSPSYASQRMLAQVPYFEAFEFLNGDSSVRRVLILDRSVAPYYSRKPYVKVIGQWGEQTMPGIASPQEALRRVRELGVSHILDIESEVSGFQVPQDDPQFALVFAAEHQRVYRVQ